MFAGGLARCNGMRGLPDCSHRCRVGVLEYVGASTVAAVPTRVGHGVRRYVSEIWGRLRVTGWTFIEVRMAVKCSRTGSHPVDLTFRHGRQTTKCRTERS